MKVCSVCQRCYDDAVPACTEKNHESLIKTRDIDCGVVPNYRLEFLHELTPDGEIYRAVNIILKKEYLIRIVSPEAFDDAGRKRFLSEAQALATIIHPNVVRVFESGTLSDGALYAVTEFAAAQTLRECFENVGSPSEVTALTITRQAAEGLEALHGVGVTHRNLKPENIILTADAENRFLIKLQNIDFGAIRQNCVIAGAEQNIGDLRYFSPEQCGAGDAVVDAQTDIYSLGIVLYEALSGRVPFDSPYADALLKKQISEQPPEIKIHSFDLRMLLSHTLSDALQKQTRTRLKSANAFARRIRHIEQLATHSSTPPPAVAYPAKMNKAAVVFTPPAKAEPIEPLKAETIIENPPPVQGIEIPPAFEARAFVDDLPPVENASVVEYAPVVETQTVFENPPVAEEFESAAPVEAETFGEIPLMMENPAPVEIPAAFETAEDAAEAPLIEAPPAVEYSFEAEPLVEELTAVETPAIVTEETPAPAPAAFESSPELQTTFEENPAEIETLIESVPQFEADESNIEEPIADTPVIEFTPPIETPAAFAGIIPVEAAETVAEESFTLEDQPVIEIEVEPQPVEALSVEAQTEVEEIVSAEPAAEIVALENEPDAADAAAIERPAAPAEAETVFIDYTTTKLPPVEAVLGKRMPEHIVITEIEPIFSLKRAGSPDIHKTSEPVKIDWEQPDDVPTTTQALNFNKKLNADAAFHEPQADFIDDDDIIEAGDVDEPIDADAAEDYEPYEPRAAERPVFSYDDSRTTWSLPDWNLPDKRKIMTGAGVLALLVLAVGGTLLSRQLWSARASRQTTAQSSTSDKTVTKPVEPAKVPAADPPAAVQPETVNAELPPAEAAATVPELPNYQPRGETDAKAAALPVASENRGKKRVLKEAVENLDRAVQTKTATTAPPVFDKKGNVKPPPDKKATLKNQVSTPAKTDIFTRPRIVKTQ